MSKLVLLENCSTWTSLNQATLLTQSFESTFRAARMSTQKTGRQDCSTDSQQLIARIEREVTTSPMLIGGRILTSEISEENALVARPSISRATVEKTPKMDHKYFDLERCYAPFRGLKSRGLESATRSCQSLNHQCRHRIMKRDRVKTPLLSSLL